jgi:hypothetical protein
MSEITINLKARSSTGEPYDVVFCEHDNHLYVLCSCNAGINYTLCKHRIDLIEGDRSRLHTEPPDEDWHAVQSLVAAYGLGKALNQIRAAEVAVEEAKEQVKMLKTNLVYELDHGVPPMHTKRA